MPKLPKNVAKQVEQEEGGGLLLEPGRYVGRLKEVRSSDQPGPSGAHYWTWEFDKIHTLDGTRKPGRQWLNTSLSENAFWKLKEAFDAFDADPDTDTDELCGHWCILVISQRVIEQGSRKGELSNNVDQLMPLDEELTDGTIDWEAAGEETEEDVL